MKKFRGPTRQSTKVVMNRFEKDDHQLSKPKLPKLILRWFWGVCFFIIAIGVVTFPILFLIFDFIGFIIIPPGHNYIERKLGFRLTTKIKTLTILLLLSASVVAINSFDETNTNDKVRPKDIKSLDAKNETDAVSFQRRDSFDFYVQHFKLLRQEHKASEALEQLNMASSFAKTREEINEVKEWQADVVIVKVKELIKAKRYLSALPLINKLLNANPDDSELKYLRAVCYSNTGNIKDAVNDLKPLIEAADTKAKKLYERINPIRKRVIDYETLCNDGTSSSATGIGACSHHGGVKEWNHPVYEESRAYE